MGELLFGVVELLRIELLSGAYIQADETTVSVQSDGYAAYGKIGGPGLLHFGCWAHVRRKFMDASKLDVRDARSVAVAVVVIG